MSESWHPFSARESPRVAGGEGSQRASPPSLVPTPFIGETMTHCSKHVRPKTALERSKVSGALATAWSRIWPKMGKGAFADAIGADTKTVDRAVTGETLPSLHTALNSLIADQTALDEVLALYGFKLSPLTADAANDFHTAADLARAAGAFMDALSDGRRDHLETLALGALFRDLLPRIQAVVSDADRIRMGEAA